MELHETYGVGFTKAELVALVAFTGTDDRVRVVRFRFDRSGWLCLYATDGHRALEVRRRVPRDATVHGLCEGDPEEWSPIELQVRAELLRDASRVIQRPDPERAFLDLDALLEHGARRAEVKIVDIEAGHTVSVMSRTDAVSTQLEIGVDALRSCISMPTPSQAVADIMVQPKYLVALNKVAAGAKSDKCRVHMPSAEMSPVIIEAESPWGDQWRLAVMPMRDLEDGEDPRDFEDDMAEAGGIQTRVASVDRRQKTLEEAVEDAARKLLDDGDVESVTLIRDGKVADHVDNIRRRRKPKAAARTEAP